MIRTARARSNSIVAGHQAQADLDGDERDGDCAAPLQNERRLECGPQDVHRCVAVLAADRADVPDLLGAPSEHLECRQPLENIEEERAQPSELDESTLRDRPRPATDQSEQQDEDRPGEQQDQCGGRVEHQDRTEHEQRDGDGKGARRLERGDVRVDRVHPVDDDADQFPAPLATRIGGPQPEQVRRQILPQPALDPTGSTLREGVCCQEQRRPDGHQDRDEDEQRTDVGQRAASEEDVGDDEGDDVRPDDGERGGDEPSTDAEGKQRSGARREREQPCAGGMSAIARDAHRGRSRPSSRARRRRSCRGRCSRRRSCTAARTACR